MEKTELLVKQYEILVDLLDHHHRRWIDHWRAYLTALTIMTGIATATAVVGRDAAVASSAPAILAAVLGAIISGAAWISINRIRNDGRLTFLHLRKTEGLIVGEVPSGAFVPLFTRGRKLFTEGVLDDLEFKPSRPRWLRKVDQYHLATVACGSFLVFFLTVGIIVIAGG